MNLRHRSYPLVAIPATVCVAVLTSTPAHALTSNWNTNSSGLFTAGSNWNSGVPGTPDTAQFNRGTSVSYNVTFPGGSIIAPPPVYTNDRLIIRSNAVGFQRGTGVNGPSYVLKTRRLIPRGTP